MSDLVQTTLTVIGFEVWLAAIIYLILARPRGIERRERIR